MSMLKALVFVMFIVVGSLAASAAHAASGFSLEVRVKNLSSEPTLYSFTVSKSMMDFDGWKDWDFLPMMGYAGKAGLSEERPEQDAWLGQGEDSGWMKMPTSGRVLHVNREGEGAAHAEVEVRIKNEKQDLSRAFSWEGDHDALHIRLYHTPVTVEPAQLILMTGHEYINAMRSTLREATAHFPADQRSPQRMSFSTSMHVKDSDDPELIRKHLALLREIGVNGMFSSTVSTMEAQLTAEAGFPFISHWSVSTFPFNYASLEMNRKVYETYAINDMDTYKRSFGRERVTVLHGDDELWSGHFEPFVALGPKVKPLVVAYLQEQGVPPADLGVKDYSEITIIPPGVEPPYGPVIKEENPALYYWLNKARMNHLAEQCRLTGEVADRFYPNLELNTPNWPAGAMLDGGYDGQGWDLWMVYSKGGLRGTSGEPTAGYNFWLQGIFSYYVDYMRAYSQGSDRMGSYVTTIRAGYPRFLNHFKVYELIARGVTDIHWYDYGGMWSNESGSTVGVQDLLLEEAIIHHEAAIYEDHLLDTELEPARVAILWTPEQEIWEPTVHKEMVALYLILLHDNYAVDFIAGYDVADGALDQYQVVYMPFEYVERDVWSQLQAWVEAGGRLVLDGGQLKDEYNRPISLQEWMPGYAATREARGDDIGVLVNLHTLPLLDTATTMEPDATAALPVMFSKTVLTPPTHGRTILKYQDGSPAAVEAEVGKGKVSAFGFCTGLSYLRDQIVRDEPSWSDITAWHDFSPALRQVVTSPVREAGITRVCEINDDMVVARRRVGDDGRQCIVLFDYHFGQDPQTPVFPEWPHIGERTVKVHIGAMETIQSVRGEIIKQEGSHVWVKFKGIDMLLVN